MDMELWQRNGRLLALAVCEWLTVVVVFELLALVMLELLTCSCTLTHVSLNKENNSSSITFGMLTALSPMLLLWHFFIGISCDQKTQSPFCHVILRIPLYLVGNKVMLFDWNDKVSSRTTIFMLSCYFQ